MTDGWQVEPRPSVPALAEDFKAPTFVPIAEVISEMTGLSEERLVELGGVPDPISPEPLRSRTEWVSVAEKLDAGGLAILARFGTIGDPLNVISEDK